MAPVTREVGEQELVSKRLPELLSSGSKYITGARARGVQAAARRGLQNTSIAGGAGESAAISSALPIATSDAQAYREAAAANLAEAGAAERMNVSLRGQAYGQRQAGEIAEAAAATGQEYNLELQQRAADIQAASAEIAQSYQVALQNNAGDINAAAAEVAQAHNITLAEVAQANSLALQTNAGAIAAQQALTNFGYDQATQDRAAQISMDLEAQRFDYNQVLQQMDVDSRQALQQLQNEFQTQAASSAEAASIVRGTLAAIAAVVTTPGITPAEITRATDIVTDQARAALVVLDTDLSDIFPEAPAGTAAPAGVISAAVPPADPAVNPKELTGLEGNSIGGPVGESIGELGNFPVDTTDPYGGGRKLMQWTVDGWIPA